MSYKHMRKVLGVKKNRAVVGEVPEDPDAPARIVELAAEVLSKLAPRPKFKVTVIVTVYNRLEIMDGCLHSLADQSMPKADFEVLFVDDFSSTPSVDYIKANISPELNYRILQRPIKSGGASVPRNDGFMAAAGEYIFNLDSDDALLPYCLEEGYAFSKANGSDITYVKISSDSNRSFGVRPFRLGNVTRARIRDNHLVRSLMSCKFLRTQFARDHGLHFPIGMRIGEDRVFWIRALSKARTISILGEKPFVRITLHEAGHLSRAGRCINEEFEMISQSLVHIWKSERKEDSRDEFFSCFLNVMLENMSPASLDKNIPKAWQVAHFDRIVAFALALGFQVIDDCIYRENRDLKDAFVAKDFARFAEAALRRQQYEAELREKANPKASAAAIATA